MDKPSSVQNAYIKAAYAARRKRTRNNLLAYADAANEFACELEAKGGRHATDAVFLRLRAAWAASEAEKER